MDESFTFTISESYSPDDIPMERLGEYLTAFAQLLGERDNVHFVDLTRGSAVLKAAAEAPAVPKIHKRLASLENGEPAGDVEKAYRQLDELLRDDNATGTLTSQTGATIIRFPGKFRPEPIVYGPVKQSGSITGQICRIGGKDSTIHLTILNGQGSLSGLEVSRDEARKLGSHFLGAPLRFHGDGTWYRDGKGKWELKRFKVKSWESLPDEPLSDLFSSIRQVQGSGWAKAVAEQNGVQRKSGSEN